MAGEGCAPTGVITAPFGSSGTRQPPLSFPPAFRGAAPALHRDAQALPQPSPRRGCGDGSGGRLTAFLEATTAWGAVLTWVAGKEGDRGLLGKLPHRQERVC